jgi:hypothetical protein
MSLFETAIFINKNIGVNAFDSISTGPTEPCIKNYLVFPNATILSL